MSNKKSFIGVSTDGDPTSLSGNNRYTPYPMKTQDMGTGEYEKKAPDDVEFKDPPLEIQYNDAIYPTVTPTSKTQDFENKANTSFKDLDNEQVDRADPKEKANRSGIPATASWSILMNELKFSGITTIENLLKTADLIPGGKGDKLDHDEIPKKEMEVGKEIESEHTPNEKMQAEIVADHEQEALEMTGEPAYYTYLTDMEDQMKEEGGQEKVSKLIHMEGHKNSKGEEAPWVIKSHENDKILSSHESKEEAEKHLQQMHIFSSHMFNKISSIEELLKV